jgi:iron complex transport system permease protein
LGAGVALLLAIAWRVFGFDLPAESEIRALALEGRVLRCASAVIVGSGLACAGVLLQSFLRNPLASPDLLGMASGSGLGIMVAVLVSYFAFGQLADPGPIGALGCSLLGALASLAIVWMFSRSRGSLSATTVVLMGVVVGLVAAGGISVMQYMLPDKGVAAGRLLLGALRDDVSVAQVGTCAACTLASIAVAFSRARAMDAATLSDDEAISVGVSLASLRRLQFVLAGVLTACSVVLAGPIAFVGLLCPHAARMLVGAHHAKRIIIAVLLGACTLVIGDCIVQLLRELLPTLGRLPLGVLTSVLGGPLFVWLIARRQHAYH